MKKTILAVLAIVALALTSTAMADGKETYDTSCAKCHGADGKGATKMGAKLGCKDYTTTEVKADAAKAVKEGMKDGDKTLMKPSELTDAEIQAALDYMKTFKK